MRSLLQEVLQHSVEVVTVDEFKKGFGAVTGVGGEGLDDFDLLGVVDKGETDRGDVEKQDQCDDGWKNDRLCLWGSSTVGNTKHCMIRDIYTMARTTY